MTEHLVYLNLKNHQSSFRIKYYIKKHKDTGYEGTT